MGAATILAHIENMKKTKCLVFAFLMLVPGASTAVALDPMGPPTAGLAEGQVKIGIQYRLFECGNKIGIFYHRDELLLYGIADIIIIARPDQQVSVVDEHGFEIGHASRQKE